MGAASVQASCSSDHILRCSFPFKLRPNWSCTSGRQNAFGEDFGSDLWRYLSDGASEKVAMDVDMFSRRFFHLLGHSTQSYVELLTPPEHMLRICAQCAGAGPTEADETFIAVLTTEMDKAGSDVKDLTQWVNRTISRLFFDSVQCLLGSVFISPMENNILINHSKILSSFQMWFLQCILPGIYFSEMKGKNGVPQQWTSLYSSFEHGISATRFQQLVFCYHGPTVTIIQMEDTSTVVFALDQEWRNSGMMFGGADCVFFQLTPIFKKVIKSSAIYCNLKLQNCPRKLSFKDEFELDASFSGVVAVETFGCGDLKALKEKQMMDERQRRQIERNKKVLLPGEWDENPDKLLLELSGVYSTEDRREVFNRNDG